MPNTIPKWLLGSETENMFGTWTSDSCVIAMRIQAASNACVCWVPEALQSCGGPPVAYPKFIDYALVYLDQHPEA